MTRLGEERKPAMGLRAFLWISPRDFGEPCGAEKAGRSLAEG
jgi:hypothetical protein